MAWFILSVLSGCHQAKLQRVMPALNGSLFDMPYTATRRSKESSGGSDWAVIAFPDLSPKLDRFNLQLKPGYLANPRDCRSKISRSLGNGQSAESSVQILIGNRYGTITRIRRLRACGACPWTTSQRLNLNYRAKHPYANYRDFYLGSIHAVSRPWPTKPPQKTSVAPSSFGR